MPSHFMIPLKSKHMLPVSLVLSLFAFLGRGLAADGNVVTHLDLSRETVGKPPEKGLYDVGFTADETILVQTQPGDDSAKEIVITGKDDKSGAKHFNLDLQRLITGTVNVDIEFTVRQMDGNTDGEETPDNVWAIILGIDNENIIVNIGAGPPDKHVFGLAGVKPPDGQTISNPPWNLGQTYKLSFAFNFITEKVDITLDGAPWIKDASLLVGPASPGGIRGITIGDGQNTGGSGKHPSQLAISHLDIYQP